MLKKFIFFFECWLYFLIYCIRDIKDEEENKILLKEEVILFGLNCLFFFKYWLIWKDNVRGIFNKMSLYFLCLILFLIILIFMLFIVLVLCMFFLMVSIFLLEKDRDLRLLLFMGIIFNF